MIQQPFNSLTKDDRWLDTYFRLIEYDNFFSIVPKNGTLPNQSKLYQRLRRWLQYQRKRNKNNKLQKWQVNCLVSIDDTFCYDYTIKRKKRSHQYYPSECIKLFMKNLPYDFASAKFKYSFSGFKYPYVTKPSKSPAEHMLKSLVRKEVKLSDCNFIAKYGTIQRVLAYIISDHVPNIRLNRMNTPRYVRKIKKEGIPIYSTSFYFEKESIPTKIVELMNATLKNNYGDLLHMLQHATDSDEVKDILKDHIDMFDKSHFPKGGLGKSHIISIHDTKYPQPRRTNFSVIFDEPTYLKSMNTYAQHMFIYGAAGKLMFLIYFDDLHTLTLIWLKGRPLIDYKSRPMPPDISELGEMVWWLVRDYLQPLAFVCPPNHCQVCLYNSLLGSEMGPHKDNGFKNKLGKLKGNTSGEKQNSHIFGTEVIIVTIGDPMNFLLIPPPQGRDYTASYKEHASRSNIGNASIIPLNNCSVYIHTAHDDEQFVHKLEFPEKTNKNCVRFAFIYRWLQNTKPFIQRNNGMFHIDAFQEVLDGYPKTGTQWLELNGYPKAEVKRIRDLYQF